MSDGADTIRVLHVDDEPDLGDVVGSFLEREADRIDVETATTASEGLAIVADRDVDCIVSDYDMPGRNGIEFLERIREEHADLPFILYTGKGSEEVASDAISAGVTDYLQKESGTDQYTLLANRVVNAVERYRAEREAAHTQTQLQAISENSTDVIVIIDADSRIKFVNPAVETVVGYEPSELRGESLTTIMPERYREEHRDGIGRYVKTGEGTTNWSNIEFHGRHRDGTEIPLSGSFSEFEQGGEQRFIGILRDITERKEQKRRLETLIDNLPGIVYQARNEPDWPMDIVRGECAEITGYSAEALERGEVIWGEDVLHPDDQEQMWDAVQEALDNDGPFEVTYRIRTKDGETRWMWERGRLTDAPSQDGTVLEGFITDVTERKEREKKLQHTKRRLDLAMGEAQAGLWEWNLDTDELYWSDELLGILGIDPDEFDGEIDAFDDRLHPDDVDPIEAAVEDAIETSGHYQVEQRLEDEDGEYAWLDVRGQVVEDDGTTSMVGIGIDITERKEQERQLQR